MPGSSVASVSAGIVIAAATGPIRLFAPASANVRVPAISVASAARSPATIVLCSDALFPLKRMPPPLGAMLFVIVLLLAFSDAG